MKLINFSPGDSSTPQFGVVIAGRALAFSVLARRASRSAGNLSDSRRYLAGLPDSEQAARELLSWGEDHLSKFGTDEAFLLNQVQLHAPIDVRALFDFGLTPKHLSNSARTLAEYEKPYPETTALLAAFENAISTDTDRSGPLPYYKSNMNSIVGDDVTVPWPAYTSRLDVEPELAFVYGNPDQPIAGFCIFNDISARDVQAPEFVGGFCLTKDMANGNQIGPYLVTQDEVGDPYQQTVDVVVNGQPRFCGNTSQISHHAEEVIAFLETLGPLRPGSVIGFGTIPDCTGLDLDDFLNPGDEVEIKFERLGSLRCRFGTPSEPLLPSRWPVRPELEPHHRAQRTRV